MSYNTLIDHIKNYINLSEKELTEITSFFNYYSYKKRNLIS